MVIPISYYGVARLVAMKSLFWYHLMASITKRACMVPETYYGHEHRRTSRMARQDKEIGRFFGKQMYYVKRRGRDAKL